MSVSPKAAGTIPVEGHLARLHIVPLADLVPHEQADSGRVARLVERIRTDETLKNPVIVTPIPGTSRYMVMDGANRTAALTAAGVRDVLVQVVRYDDPGASLATWNHLITGIVPNDLLHAIAAIPDVELRATSLDESREELESRRIMAYLVHPPHDGKATEVYTIRQRAGSDRHESEVLLDVVNLYKANPAAAIHRVSSDELDDHLTYYNDASALIVFPPYKPEDLLDLARNGHRVPTGITRHIIPARALRVNVPLSLLADDAMSIAAKNDWWLDNIRRKLSRNEIRFYQESTYLFDE